MPRTRDREIWTGARAAAARLPSLLLAVAALAAVATGCVAEPAARADAPAPAAAASPTVGAAVADTARGTVVLLHGLGRTHWSMWPLERALRDEGYRVVNLGYPSRDHTVAELAEVVAAELARCCAEDGQLHFVTHSLGGILVRAYGAVHGPERIGRVVMLSPPNQGSEVVDRIPEELLGWVMGPAALQLGTDTASVLHDLPPVDFELGIITGDATLNPLFSWWLPGEDDGKVTVESARVEGVDEFLVVPYSHTFIMHRSRVIEEVLSFLSHGVFAERIDG